MPETIQNITPTRYTVEMERAASTKGVDGFKVKVSGDDALEVRDKARLLYAEAKTLTGATG